MSTTTVTRVHEEHDVYVGRPGPWGNPFPLGQGHSRDEVVALFEAWMRTSNDSAARWIRAHIHELHGKRLGCYCAPLRCHGDVLAYWADRKHAERSTS